MPFTRAAVLVVTGFAVSCAFAEFTSTALMFLVRPYRSRYTNHNEKASKTFQLYKISSKNIEFGIHMNLRGIGAIFSYNSRSKCINYILTVRTDEYKTFFLFFLIKIN